MHSDDIIPKIALEQCSSIQIAILSGDNIPKIFAPAEQCNALKSAMQSAIWNELYSLGFVQSSKNRSNRTISISISLIRYNKLIEIEIKSHVSAKPNNFC